MTAVGIYFTHYSLHITLYSLLFPLLPRPPRIEWREVDGLDVVDQEGEKRFAGSQEKEEGDEEVVTSQRRETVFVAETEKDMNRQENSTEGEIERPVGREEQ